jgi:hypothetical protein
VQLEEGQNLSSLYFYFLRKYYLVGVLPYFVFRDWLIAQFYVSFYRQKLLLDQIHHHLDGQKII